MFADEWTIDHLFSYRLCCQRWGEAEDSVGQVCRACSSLCKHLYRKQLFSLSPILPRSALFQDTSEKEHWQDCSRFHNPSLLQRNRSAYPFQAQPAEYCCTSQCLTYCMRYTTRSESVAAVKRQGLAASTDLPYCRRVHPVGEHTYYITIIDQRERDRSASSSAGY